jgi:hypothetical protein
LTVLLDAASWVEHAAASLCKLYLTFRALAAQRLDRDAQLHRCFGLSQLLHN